MMRKEVFKNITLVTLIFISVLLFSKIWFGDNLIYGDSFSFMKKGGGVTTIEVEGIIMPKRIVLTGNNKRCCILKGTTEYGNCYSAIKDFFAVAESETLKFESAETTEWGSALKSRSVLLDYGSTYSSSVLSKITMTLPQGEIKELILVPESSVLSRVSVYAKDLQGGAIYKAALPQGYSSISGLIDTYIVGENVNNLPFAFELGFDKVRTFNEDISQNTLLDSNIIIGLKDVVTPEITVSENIKSVMDDGNKIEDLLSAFAFKIGSVRRYIEENDAMVFVDSNATLKVYSDGWIEYAAENRGIPLDTSEDMASRSLESMYSLVRRTAKIFNMPEHEIQIYSNITDEIYGNAAVYMDYYFNGVPVIVDDNGKTSHTISFDIKDGMIVGFKQYLYEFSNTGGVATNGSMVSSLDSLNEKYGNTAMKISDMYIAYVCKKREASVHWCVRSEGTDTIEIID